jgi:dihydrofolate synthase/folylpolyglutamate synthase
VVSHIAPLADTAIVTSPPWEKAAPAESVAEEVRKYLPAERVKVVEPVMNAVNTALSMADKDDLILITGSFYTIGEVDEEAVKNRE